MAVERLKTMPHRSDQRICCGRTHFLLVYAEKQPPRHVFEMDESLVLATDPTLCHVLEKDSILSYPRREKHGCSRKQKGNGTKLDPAF